MNAYAECQAQEKLSSGLEGKTTPNVFATQVQILTLHYLYIIDLASEQPQRKGGLVG